MRYYQIILDVQSLDHAVVRNMVRRICRDEDIIDHEIVDLGEAEN